MVTGFAIDKGVIEGSLPIGGLSSSAAVILTYLNGWISKEDVLEVYEVLKKNQYGQYLKDVLDGKYMDVLR